MLYKMYRLIVANYASVLGADLLSNGAAQDEAIWPSDCVLAIDKGADSLSKQLL